MDISKSLILLRSSLIQGWVTKKELRILYDLASSYITENGLTAEVGSWKGRSTYVIASVCKQKHAQLFAIDTFCGSTSLIDGANREGGAYYEALLNSEAFFRRNIGKNLNGLPVKYLKMKSHEASKRIRNGSLDFCFIDGDHTLPVVINDIKDYLPKVKNHGIILGHDYSFEKNPKNHVKYAVDKILGLKDIEVYESIWTYIKK